MQNHQRGEQVRIWFLVLVLAFVSQVNVSVSIVNQNSRIRSQFYLDLFCPYVTSCFPHKQLGIQCLVLYIDNMGIVDIDPFALSRRTYNIYLSMQNHFRMVF